MLEEAGASVTVQAWDFVPGSNFALEVQRAAREAERTIAVVSPDYPESWFAAPESAAAFAQDPERLIRKLVPVRVRDCTLEGLLQPIVYIDLVGLDAASARKELLIGLDSKRGKPASAPPFRPPFQPLTPKAFPGANRQRPAAFRFHPVVILPS